MRAFVNGNQTLIKTSTGVWSVTYNAENRPVRWESGDTVITMNFDRMGRRVFYKEEVAGVVTKHHKFVYDNYLCVQKVDALNNNSQINLFVWDPTEPVATRLLFTTGSGNRKFFYTCDGNKNVSEMVHFEQRNGIAAHYDYAPFGAVTRAISASVITDNTFTTDNPFRFSSECHDDTLGLVYYNYRHYNPIDGRWCGRDFISLPTLYLAFLNNSIVFYDVYGLFVTIEETIDTYKVGSAEDFQTGGMLDGFGEVTADFGTIKYAFPSFVVEPVVSASYMACEDGKCPFLVKGVAQIMGAVTIKYRVPEFDIASRQNVKRKRRIKKIIDHIVLHEKSHLNHYRGIVEGYNQLDGMVITKILCLRSEKSKDEIDSKMNEVLIGYLDELEASIDITDTTHERLGMSINPKEAVISGVLTVEYPDGRTEEVEL